MTRTYPPPQGMEASAPPVTTGIPVSSANQFYPSSNPPPFQTETTGPVPWPPVSSANQFYPSSNPPPFQTETRGPGPWSTGLFDCFDDVGNCLITCFCPCITFGQIAEIVDRGSTSCGTSGALYTLILCLTGCQCIYSFFYRSKMRGQYSLNESPCNDCLIHCCCEECALCQEYRELKMRGFDMNIGWHANMERQGRGGPQLMVAPPVVPGGMSR